MKLMRLTWINYKRMIKSIGNLIMMLIMPLIVIFGVYFVTNSGSTDMLDTNIAFNVQDRGSYGDELLKELNVTKGVFHKDLDGAMKLLERNDVVAVYNLPENFTERIKLASKPIVNSYKRRSGNVTSTTELRLNDSINRKIKEEILLKNGVIKNRNDLKSSSVISKIVYKDKQTDSSLFLVAYLIIYFIILSANNIGSEIIALKKGLVLARTITTANKGYTIIGSIYLAMFLMQVSINLGVLLIGKLVIGYSFVNMGVIVGNIILASLISISMGLFITRVIEDPGMATMTLTLIVVATTLISTLALGGDSIRNTPWIFANIAKFTPQYWLLDSLNKAKLFPNAFALLLMTVVFFTAGSFKLRNYINR